MSGAFGGSRVLQAVSHTRALLFGCLLAREAAHDFHELRHD